jgi:murein DD-endopeptidase MepM/ murein hydrolase activator NlpD
VLAAVLAPLVATIVVAGGSSQNAAAASTCAASGLATHEVVEGDTWFDIADDAGVSIRSLLRSNDASATDMLLPGDDVCLPAGATTPSSCSPANAPTHTVAAGDTWWDIATRSGSSLSTVLSANGATEAIVIRPGQRVCLPMGRSMGPTGTDAAPSTDASPQTAATLEALPMQGPCWYSDDFGDPRGGGRRHAGTDVFAETGSYVYAVVDGTLTRRTWDQPGRRSGNAWWLTADDGSGTYYFYGHLADFAPGLEVGSRVDAGEIIGFMGNTGNSSFPHLHFEVHPGGGGAVNPYPLLRALGGCKTGPGYRQPSGWVPAD